MTSRRLRERGGLGRPTLEPVTCKALISAPCRSRQLNFAMALQEVNPNSYKRVWWGSFAFSRGGYL